MRRPVIEPGIYFGMPESVYFAAEGLSNSGMKQLAVSPLSYWHQNLNPEREESEETPAQRWGKAVHCLLLEPERFFDAYAAKLSKDDYPDALDTDDDLKAWLSARNLPTTGKRKQDRIDRIKAEALEPVQVWDEIVARHAEQTAGKILLSATEMARLQRLSDTVLEDAAVGKALVPGHAEVSIFLRDPETGVMLKCRVDKLQEWGTVDLKTFSNSRGKKTEKVVNDAIYYEGYYHQAVFYHQMRELARKLLAAGDIQAHGAPDWWPEQFVKNDRHGFAFVFVESSAPFDMQVVELEREAYPDADANAYWTDAEIRIQEMTQLYAKCLKRYGDEPWRDPVRPRTLQDTDIPQLLFAGSSL